MPPPRRRRLRRRPRRPRASAAPVEIAGRRARPTSPTDQILKIDLGQEPPTLDPNKAQDSTSIAVLHALNRGLVYFDKDLKIVPALAECAAERLGRRQDPDLHT